VNLKQRGRELIIYFAFYAISPSSREQNGDILEVLKRLACKHDTLVRALHPQPFLDWLDWLLWHVDHIVPSAFGNSRE
jgi:hypothetical protein